MINRGKRPVETTALTLAAVAGILMMHGFDGATLSLTQIGGGIAHHSDHSDVHTAFGLCIFVVSVAGLGVTTVGTVRRHRPTTSAWVAAIVPPSWLAFPPRTGRLRLIDLGVLRL